MAYLSFPGKQPGPGTELVERINWTPNGLGCADCGGTCGLGLFDGVSDWGVLEYLAMGLGAFAAFSMFSTTKRGVVATRKAVRRRRKRTALATA